MSGKVSASVRAIAVGRASLIALMVASGTATLASAAWSQTIPNGNGTLPGMRFYDAEQLTPAAAKSNYYDGATSAVSYAWGSQKPWEITATAGALENDPKKIFAFVKNQIRFEPRFGAQKGAVGAVIDRSGTAFDQAQLLVELLRAAGNNTATYQVGTLTLSGSDFVDWIGISDPAAARQFLANGGIPAEVTGSSSISSVTLAHAWVTATVDGTTVTLDPSYKRMDRWSQVNVASLSGLSPSSFVSTATTTTGSGTDAGSVPYITGVNLSGARSQLDTAANQMLTALKGATYNTKSSEEIYGGERIRQLDDPWANKTTGTLSATWGSYTGGLPDKYRTKLKIVAGLCQASLWADEVYGRRIAYRARTYREAGPESHVEPAPGEYDIITINGKPLPGSSSAGTVSSECAQPPPAGSPLFALDLPYAARAVGGAYGTWMDRNVTKAFDQGVTEFVIGWGDTGSELQTRLADDFQTIDSSLVLDGQPFRTAGETPPGVFLRGNPAGPPVGNAKLYAAWLAQMTRARQLAEGISSSRIQHHYTLGVIYSQVQREVGDGTQGRPANGWHDPGETIIGGSVNDTSTRIDIDSGFSTTLISGGAAEKKAVRHLVAAFGAMLEGSVFEQQQDVPETSSTARRFPWAQQDPTNSAVTRYHLLSPGGTSPAEYRQGLLSGSESAPTQGAPCRAQEMADRGVGLAGYAVIKVNNRFLGPGTIPSNDFGPPGIWPYTRRVGESDQTMARGCAWIAFNADASEIAQVVTSVDRAFKGAGGQPEKDTAGRSPPPQADLLKDTFKDRSNIGGVDLRTGVFTYSPPADITIGQGEFPYSLSFQRTYQRGGMTCPKCLPGWTHNFDIRATVSGGGLEAMGETTPLALASPLVGLKAAFELYKSDGAAIANHVAAMGVMNWLADRLTYNVVTVNQGASSETFVRLADGNFAAAPGSQSKLTQSGERTMYASNALFGRTPIWLYGGPYNPTPISFVKTSGSGDKITFVWRDSNPTEIVPNGWSGQKNYAQGFFASTWQFPAGVTLNFTYCQEADEGASVGPGNPTFYSLAVPCGDRLRRVEIAGTSLYLDIDRLNVTSADGRSAFATSAIAPLANAVYGYTPVTQSARAVTGYVDVLGNREEYQWAAPSTGGRPTADPFLVRVLSPVPYAGGIVARPDDYTVTTGVTAILKPLANDDPKFGLTISSVGQASHGTVSRAPTQVSYTSAAGFVGDDSFTYKVRDESGAWAQSTVVVHVSAAPAPTNHPPVARDDEHIFYRLGPGFGYGYFDPVGNNDTDEDQLSGTLKLISPPSPDWEVGASGNGRPLRYTNTAFTYGTERRVYSYSIQDDAGATSSANIYITVPDRPVVAGNDAKEWDISTGDPYVDILANDYDPDGLTVTITSISDPSKAVIAGNRLRLLNGQPGESYSLTYTISDGYWSATASVAVSVVNNNSCWLRPWLPCN